LREHLVKKLVSAIFPGTDQNSSTSPNDERIVKLFSFARRVEEDMYNKATTREDYYHMLAEKIYKIQKELELKRNPAQPGSNPQNPNQGGPLIRPPIQGFPGQNPNQQNPNQQNPNQQQPGLPQNFQNPNQNPNMNQNPQNANWNQQQQNPNQMNPANPGTPGQFMNPSTPNQNQNQNQNMQNAQQVKTEPGDGSKNMQNCNNAQNPSKSFSNQPNPNENNAADMKPVMNHQNQQINEKNIKTDPDVKPKIEAKIEAKPCPKREAQSPAPSPVPGKKPKEEVKEETDPGTLKKWSAQEWSCKFIQLAQLFLKVSQLSLLSFVLRSLSSAFLDGLSAQPFLEVTQLSSALSECD
jgi:hypothetical protein